MPKFDSLARALALDAANSSERLGRLDQGQRLSPSFKASVFAPDA
jgi:hypothetical protein